MAKQGLPLSHRWSMFRYNFKDNVCMFIVWNLLPRRIVYWCAIRVGAHATTGKFGNQNVPALTMADALKRWGMDNTDNRPPMEPINPATQATRG